MSRYDMLHPGDNQFFNYEEAELCWHAKTRVVLITQLITCNHMTQWSLSECIIVNYTPLNSGSEVSKSVTSRLGPFLGRPLWLPSSLWSDVLGFPLSLKSKRHNLKALTVLMGDSDEGLWLQCAFKWEKSHFLRLALSRLALISSL